MSTPNLELEQMPSNSLQPSVPFNDAMQVLDALVQARAQDKDLTAPPVTVAGDAGKCWIMTSDWAVTVGRAAGDIALCVGADLWRYFTPSEGWRFDVLDEDVEYRFDSTEWVVNEVAATNVGITDAGGYFVGTTVEAALQELGAGGGGGGGSSEEGSKFSGMDYRNFFEAEYGPDEGYDEEFDGAGIADGTLPTDWVWVNQDTAVYRQKFSAGRVDYGGGGDDSNIHAVLRPLPATTTFDAFAHLFGMHNNDQTYAAQFLLYNSVNGRFVGLQCWQPATSPFLAQFYVIYYTDADTQTTTLAGPISLFPAPQGRCYYRITKASDASYNFEVSPDGGCWFRVGTALTINTSLGGDPTHIGFGLTTSGAAHTGCEWLRIRDLT